MTSYNVERARGDDLLNSVALVKRTQNLSIQEAFDAVAERFLTYADEFLDIMKTLPLDSNPNLKAYVHCCGFWATAAHEWAFEIGRYRLSPEARHGGRVQVLPKKVMNGTSH
jgi:Delta6-protoilludene synthase